SAGSDTTIYSLGNTLRALAEFSDQYQLLRSNIDEFAVRAFEEGIRYDNPARFTRRRATTDLDVDGVALPADAKILLLHMPGRAALGEPGGLRHHPGRGQQAPRPRVRRARLRGRAGRAARGRVAAVGAGPPRAVHRAGRRAGGHDQHGGARPREAAAAPRPGLRAADAGWNHAYVREKHLNCSERSRGVCKESHGPVPAWHALRILRARR